MPRSFYFPTSYLSLRPTVWNQLHCPFFMLQRRKLVNLDIEIVPFNRRPGLWCLRVSLGSRVKPNQQQYRQLTAQEVAQDHRWDGSSLTCPLRARNGIDSKNLHSPEIKEKGVKKTISIPKHQGTTLLSRQIHSVDSLWQNYRIQRNCEVIQFILCFQIINKDSLNYFLHPQTCTGVTFDI